MSQIDADKSDRETFGVIGAAMEVHRVLGHGFLEGVYGAALAIEFESREISFRREAPFSISYKRQKLPIGYRVDFLCFDQIIVELKATSGLTKIDEAQALNYLKASGQTRAILLNFGMPRLEYKRLINTPTHLRLSATSAVKSDVPFHSVTA